ncbi:MAG: hypothetical protein N3A66_11810, partial [Planctomycetota bacterium]|nr:hypothetical protein [Planctomycetota bacterium]
MVIDPPPPAEVLRPALILPLRWRRGSDSALLPRAFRDLAETVRRDVLCQAASGWGLEAHPLSGLQDCDLSGLSFKTVDSAYAALALSLLVAVRGGRMKPDIMLTAAWLHQGERGRGFVEVEGIEAKCEVAVEFGCRTLYISASQAERLGSEWKGMRLEALPYGHTLPLSALRGLLHLCQVPPRLQDGDAFEVCCEYADAIPQQGPYRQERERYILAEIIREHARRLREKTDRPAPQCQTLALLMSSASAAALSLRYLQPKHCLILLAKSDKNWEDNRRLLEEHLKDMPIDLEFYALANPRD